MGVLAHHLLLLRNRWASTRPTKYLEIIMANGEAIGLIETKGIRGRGRGVDAALKAANVQFVEQHKVGSGLVAITVKGDVAAVRAAVDAGAEAAGRVGEVVRSM